MIRKINELNLTEKICYIFQFVEKNDIDDSFYLHDFIYEDIKKSDDKDRLLEIVSKILEKLNYTYFNSYDEYLKFLNLDIELELLPLLEKEENKI